MPLTILKTTRGNPMPWTSDGFRASWGAVCDTAKIDDVTFHDLRGTFITLAYREHGASFRESPRSQDTPSGTSRRSSASTISPASR